MIDNNIISHKAKPQHGNCVKVTIILYFTEAASKLYC